MGIRSDDMKRLTPCGRTRREWLWEAGGGFAGTALTYLLAGDGFSARLLRPRRGVFRRCWRRGSLTSRQRRRACIFLFMYGRAEPRRHV